MYGETSLYGEFFLGVEQVEALGADAIVWATQHGLVGVAVFLRPLSRMLAGTVVFWVDDVLGGLMTAEL